MLRKTSAAEPVLGVIGTFCIEPPEVAPVDPPPEALILSPAPSRVRRLSAALRLGVV
jgi:hypothetical protein